MQVDERARRLLTDDLVRVHGEEVADILMAHLPPVGWADVATKQDLDQLAALFRAELAAQLAGFDTRLAGFATRLAGFDTRLAGFATREELARTAENARAQLDEAVTSLRQEIKHSEASLRQEIAELRGVVMSQTRWLFGMFVTCVIGAGAIVIDVVFR